MKKIFTLIAAALMSASMFAQPATVPYVRDLEDAGYDVTSARVICLYFDEQVYYDIVWAGSYNGWSIDNPASMIHFEPLEGYQGWYACQVNDARTPQADQKISTGDNCCVGKPVQLKKDGSFSWDFQSGDADAWTNMAQPGTKQHYIYGGQPDEADICWNEYGAYIYDVAYFKNHNTPYGAPDDPVLATLDSLVIKGKATKMEYEVGEAFDPAGLEVWGIYTKIEKHDSTSQIMSGITWTLDPETFEEASDNASVTMVASFKELTTADTTITGIKVKQKPVPKYTTYENWQLKYEGSEWENMTKVEEGLFKLVDFDWKTRSGLNVKSDDNPIKKDWYDVDDPDVVIGEEVIPPVKVDVYLRVIDDETLKIGIGVEPPIQFVDTASGLKFEVTSMEEPRTVKVINNEYSGTFYTVPGTVTYWEKTFDVTEIGVEAFHDCSSLESITLPESVTTLAYSSLSTSGLKSITIPATVTTIGEYAFAGCLDLQSVTFQGNACHDTIGDNAFEDVGKTTPATLTLPDDWAGSTPENSETPWYGGYFDYTAPGPRVGGKFVDETSGLKFEITSCDGTSKTVKVIANSYTGASYDIPETVTNWEETFEVTEIDAYAFAECPLETFTVPASIVKIGAGAFSNCTSLQSVTFKGNACQNGISVTAFYGVGEDTPATLTLPDNWTGAKPESSILEWFGGFCAMSK